MRYKTVFSFMILILIMINIYLSSWFARHGEMHMHADVARDFLLLDELEEKKIVFIGARSGTSGIFHGPLWTYLNYPAYLFGKGDPEIMNWYWMLLIILFLVSSYLLSKSLTDNITALIYTLLLSGNIIFYTSSLSHSHGAMFLIPVFLYTMLLYKRLRKFKFILAHLFVGSLIIQFQIAVGIPLVLISMLITLYIVINNGNKKHLLSFIVIPMTLINFIVFDARHEFKIIKAITEYSSPKIESGLFNYSSLFFNRLNLAMDMQLSPGVNERLSGFIFAIVLFITIKQWKKKSKYRDIFIFIPIYYFGYLILTLINKGNVMYQQFFPTLPLVNFLFALTITSSRKKAIWLLLIIVVFLNLDQASSYLAKQEKEFLGKAPSSWRFLYNLGNEIVSREKDEFGYFLYSPDIFAYTPRYAMRQVFRSKRRKAYEFEKKPVTFIIAGPPAKDRPGLSYDWWRKNKVNINLQPTDIIIKSNEYMVERFELTPEEQKEPWEHLINVGIHFR